jgi:hypothetical protein
VLIIYEANDGRRQIFTDGRSLPSNDPQPWWFGYSVGKWDGDALVVQSTGFRDMGWLDEEGAPTPDRALILRGLAGALRSAGRQTDALDAYEKLANEPPVRIASLPSDFLALHEIAAASGDGSRSDRALALYEGLVDGRWTLPRELYEFYVGRRAGVEPADRRRARADEERGKQAGVDARRRVVYHPPRDADCRRRRIRSRLLESRTICGDRPRSIHRAALCRHAVHRRTLYSCRTSRR